MLLRFSCAAKRSRGLTVVCSSRPNWGYDFFLKCLWNYWWRSRNLILGISKETLLSRYPFRTMSWLSHVRLSGCLTVCFYVWCEHIDLNYYISYCKFIVHFSRTLLCRSNLLLLSLLLCAITDILLHNSTIMIIKLSYRLQFYTYFGFFINIDINCFECSNVLQFSNIALFILGILE